MMMIDWELAQLYRRTAGLPEEERLEVVRNKWLDQVCGPKRDTYFYAAGGRPSP